MRQLGLVSISFRKLSFGEILKAVKEAGLSCVEWGSDVHAPCTELEKVAAIALAQKAAGIQCCSYGTYFRFGVNKPEELLDYIKAAKLLGTDILRLWCGTKGSREYTAEELEAVYADCRTAAKIAEAHGVTLCMECHNGTLTDWKEGALALMQAVNSPAFRMYWQPNQWRTEEENLAYIKLLKNYIEHIHVFNWAGKEKYPLDQAQEQWQKYLALLPRHSALLLEFMPDDRVESLNVEAEALRKVAGE
jgi:sugar phosphate isomerase/epimerase